MKRYLCLILLVLYFFTFLIAKGNGLYADPKEKQGLIGKKEQRALIVFYSRTGNTKTVSETIRETLYCDIQEIKDLKDRTGMRGYISGMIDVRKNPITPVSPKVVNLKDYDLLFIGSPIWGMKFAPAITTFLNSADFEGKKVVLFATTSARMRQTAFDEYSELIHTKGGEVIDTFFIKTLWKDSSEIEEKAKNILAEKEGEWMQRLEKSEPENS